MSDRFSDRLSEYLDGDLVDRERLELESHLESCAACRAELDGLRAVAERARELAPSEPEADLWPAIAARIGAEPRPAAERTGGWWSRRLSLSLPQLAGAALVLMLVSVSAVWMVGRAPWLVTRGPSVVGDRPLASGPGPTAPSPTPALVTGASELPASAEFADARYDATIADLQRVLEQERSRLDPRTVRALEKNLKIIDRAVADARRAVDADPSSLYLREHLASMMKQKVSLLRQATLIASQG